MDLNLNKAFFLIQSFETVAHCVPDTRTSIKLSLPANVSLDNKDDASIFRTTDK